MANWLHSLKQILAGKDWIRPACKTFRPTKQSYRPTLQTLEDRFAPSATPFGPLDGYDGTWDAARGALLVNVAQADGTLTGNTLAIATVVDSGNTFVTLNGDQTAIKAAEVQSLSLNDTDINEVTYNLSAVSGRDFSAFTSAVAITGLGDTTLIVNDTPRLWTLSAVDGGSASGTDYGIAFTGISTINGGMGADTFEFNDGDYLTGAIDGGTGAGNTLDFSRYTTAVVANVTGGNAGSMTAAGNVFNFANIQNIIGGAGANTYDFADGGSLSILDGGSGGSNTLDFSDTTLAPVAADLTGANAGAVTAAVTFTDIQTLNGSSAGDDTYTIENGASIGAINGSAADNNTLIYPPSTNGVVTVNLQTEAATGVGSFANISNATVGETANANSLTGADTGNDWEISSANAGVINDGAFTFNGFNVLNAGAGGDAFTVDPAVTFAGVIHGNSGIDSLILGSANQTVTLSTGQDDASGFSGVVATVSGGFTGIDLLVGTGPGNTLHGENSPSNWNLDIASANQYVTNGDSLLTFTNFLNLNGGSSSNTFTCYDNFTGILNGGAGSNTFAFVGDAVLTGNIVGNAGNDTLDYTNYDTAIAVTLSADNADGFSGADNDGSILGTFSNMDTLVGSGNDADSLTGENVTATWTLAAPLYSYSTGADTLTFRNIYTVIGGAGVDSFNAGSTLVANNGDLDNIARPLSISGGAHPIGQFDTLYINDHGTIGKANYLITPTSVGTDISTTPRTFAGITYANIGFLRLDGTDAVNVFEVTPSVNTEFYINGNAPARVAVGDVLELHLAGVTGTNLPSRRPEAGSTRLPIASPWHSRTSSG